MKIEWILQGRKKFLGELKGKIFYTKKKHFFKLYDGFGFNYDLIKALSKMNVEKIIVEYFNEKYEITPGEILKNGVVKEFFPYEKQIIVNINYFKKCNENKKEG